MLIKAIGKPINHRHRGDNNQNKHVKQQASPTLRAMLTIVAARSTLLSNEKTVSIPKIDKIAIR